MAVRFNNPAPTYFDSDGTTPLNAGELNFYEVGTTDRKNTWPDNELSQSPNPNPVQLSSVGLQPNIFLDGDYRVILTDATRTQIYDKDHVNGVFAFTQLTVEGTASITNMSNAPALTITSSDTALTVLSDHTTNYGVEFSFRAATTGSDFFIHGSSSDTSIRTVLEVVQDNSQATGATTMTVKNNSTGLAILARGGITCLDTVTGSTLKATETTTIGATSEIGYTEFQGIMITGSGSVNDVTIRNHDDDTVISIPEGTFTTNFAGSANFLGSISAASDSTIGDLTLADGSITDASGTISFGSDNIETTGTITGNLNPLRGYIDGFITSTEVGNENEGIRVTPGICTDSSNTISISLATDMTKRITDGGGAWAAGNNQVGLALGATHSSDTWYHVFAVIITANPDADVMFDTDINCANGVASHNVEFYRRIGSIRTDPGLDIIPYFQNSEVFLWDIPHKDYDQVPGTYPDINDLVTTVVLRVPPGVAVEANIVFSVNNPGTLTKALITNSIQDETSPDDDNQTFPYDDNTEAITFSSSYRHFTNLSSELRFQFAGGIPTTIVRIQTVGWRDLRGRE